MAQQSDEVALDDEIAVALADLPPFVFDEETLPVARELLGSAPPPPALAGIDRDDHQLGDGVVLTVYRPSGVDGPRPCVYWMHGGGYILGTRWIDDERLQRWTGAYGCACVSVEYRLAPEHPYPTALEDCYRGLVYVAEHADQLGIDSGAIGVGGQSAGAGLAAALALAAHRRGGPILRFQVLDCPMLDDRQQWSSSQRDGLPIWSREANRFGWRSYLGARHGTEDVPETAAPARAADLSGLPPAFVSVGTADGFRDEDVAYATSLNQAGVPCELHVYPGVPHGAQSIFPTAASVRRAVRDMDEFVERAVGSPRF